MSKINCKAAWLPPNSSPLHKNSEQSRQMSDPSKKIQYVGMKPTKKKQIPKVKWPRLETFFRKKWVPLAVLQGLRAGQWQEKHDRVELQPGKGSRFSPNGNVKSLCGNIVPLDVLSLVEKTRCTFHLLQWLLNQIDWHSHYEWQGPGWRVSVLQIKTLPAIKSRIHIALYIHLSINLSWLSCYLIAHLISGNSLVW